MAINTLSVFPTDAPLIGQSKTVFVGNASGTLGYMNTFVGDFNGRVGEVNTVYSDINVKYTAVMNQAVDGGYSQEYIDKRNFKSIGTNSNNTIKSSAIFSISGTNMTGKTGFKVRLNKVAGFDAHYRMRVTFLAHPSIQSEVILTGFLFGSSTYQNFTTQISGNGVTILGSQEPLANGIYTATATIPITTTSYGLIIVEVVTGGGVIQTFDENNFILLETY